MKVSRARVYQFIVIFLALALLANGFAHDASLFRFSLIPLFLLGILVESIQIPVQRAYGTLTYGLVLGTMIVNGPDVAALMIFIAVFAAEMVKRHRRELIVTIFNAAQFAICVYVAYEVYRRLGGVIPPDDIMTPENLIVLIPATISYMVMNYSFIFGLFLIRGDRIKAVDFLKMSLNDSVNYLFSTPFAIFMLAFSDFLSVILLTFVPVVLLGQVLKLYRRISQISQVHETIYQLQSEFDLNTIYSRITDASEHLTSATATVLWVLRGDRVYPVCVSDSKLEINLPQEGLCLSDSGLVVTAVKTKRVELIHDVARDKRVRQFKISDLFRSVLVVPLKSRDRVVGVITCYGRRAHAFTVTQRDVVAVLAAQAGVIIENANLYGELQEATLRDPGTGLYNYRYFYQELSRRFANCVEEEKALSIVIIDIDHFKKYNDTYGHVVGDEVLRQTGQVIQKTVGDRGVVARYGGEEFAVLLDEPLELAKQTVEHLRRAVAHNKFEYQGYVVQGVTISVGLATYPDHDHNETELLEKADQAMYWGAKQRGRNKVAVYTPDFDAHLFVDQLTGLYTYHYMRSKLMEEFSTRHQETGQPYALLFFNIIDFDNTNRTHGFEIGNQVLREVSMILKHNMRHGEIASRYSGDEFLLAIPGVERIEAQKICDRLVKIISQHPFRVSDEAIVRLLLRSDIVIFPDDAADEQQLLSQIPDTFLQLSSKRMQTQT